MTEKIEKQNDEETVQILGMTFKLRSPDAEKNNEPTEEKTIKEDKSSSFQGMGVRFTTSLQLLWRYIKGVGDVAEATTQTNFMSLIAMMGEMVSREKNANDEEVPIAIAEFILQFKRSSQGEKEIKVALPIYDYDHFKRLRDHTTFHDAALSILHESVIQQMVNAYEKLMGDLLRHHMRTNPEAAPKDQVLSYQEILTFSSFDETKNHVIDKVVTAFLRSKNTSEQLKYFREELKVDISSHFPKIQDFRELVLRRHSIVHAGGIVTAEYLRQLKKINGYKGIIPDVGTYFSLTSDYVEAAWSIIYSLGVITLHLVERHCAQVKHEKEQESKADDFLVNAAYTAILHKQYSTAEIILRYASKLHLSKDTHDLMVIINLAQTLKWQGHQNECEEVLSTRDWPATNSLYELCIGVLHDDFNQFETLLPVVVTQKRIDIDDLFEWPIFQEIRREPRFSECVSSAFGRESNILGKQFLPMVFNVNHQATMRELLQYFDESRQSREDIIEAEFIDTKDHQNSDDDSK